MPHPADVVSADPWGTLRMVLGEPLHPGGAAATEDLLDRAEVTEGTRLLDVGCGSGGTLAQARHRGAQAVGLDRRPGGRETLRGDLHHLPMKEGSLDVVIAECVLCLATDLPMALSEIHRVLNRGGRVALSDVVVEGELRTVPEAIARMLCLDVPRNLDEVMGQLKSVGFDVQDLRSHREDLLNMRDQVASRVDYRRLLGSLGDPGQELLDGIGEVEAAIESDRLSYVSLVARR